MAERHNILALNSGSSSLKFALYQFGQQEELLVSGHLTKIGSQDGRFLCHGKKPDWNLDRQLTVHDHGVAIETLLDRLADKKNFPEFDALGHRLVHGGPKHTQPLLLTPRTIAELRDLSPLARDHLPHEIEAIELVAKRFPGIKQVACFDTAFHQNMPRAAKTFALPQHFYDQGIRRYGFHGLSYQYILEYLRQTAGQSTAQGRLIIAHLGNGASMVAVRNGQSLDTTMGMTPLAGLVMARRCGDLDPGAVLYLLREHGLDVNELGRILNTESGLIGVSGVTWDMEHLLDQEATNPQAALAVELFCRQAQKQLGALIMTLGGLDTLVFTAGIGENAPVIRARIVAGLKFLNTRLDPERNDASAPIISSEDSAIVVRVVKTNEELTIARQTFEVVTQNRT